MGAFLLLTYLVLPSVSRTQFSGLACTYFPESGDSYLTVDTSVLCSLESPEYAALLAIDIPMIVIYQAIPIMYAVLLFKHRKLLNPGFREEIAGRRKRDRDPRLSHIKFLFADYSCRRWFFEVIDMYRRIAMISLLQFVNAKYRAMVGCGFAVLSLILYQQGTPFHDAATNIVAELGQWQILLTFFMAYTLDDFEDQQSKWRIGVFILIVNLVIVVAALVLGVHQNETAHKNRVSVTQNPRLTAHDFQFVTRDSPPTAHCYS